MSEIYLTKIERKTIFTKSLIFVLIMFIISDLTVTGPFYFNFIPWLYIIGVLGSIKKIDSILMCIIGTFTVFVATLITNGMWSACVLNTVVTLANLVLGIITGRMCFEFILEHRLVKYIKHSKKIMYIVTMIVMFLLSCLMVALNSGNVVTYLKSKANLDEYITSTYNTQDYDVIQVGYNTRVQGKYVYKVEINNQQVDFVPVTKSIFKDANKDMRYLQLQRNLEAETINKVNEILQKYPLIQNSSVKFNIDYDSFGVDSKVIAMTIKHTTTEENLAEVYSQIANCVKELQKVKEAQKIIITVNDKTLQIASENIELLTVDYIKGGFEIEELS